MPDDDVHATAMSEYMGGMMGGLNTDIGLDPEIAGAWSGIRGHVVALETKEGQIFDVALGETVVLGDSGLTLSADTFVPDFVMNSGALIEGASHEHLGAGDWTSKLRGIGSTVTAVLELARDEGLTTVEAAYRMAQDILEQEEAAAAAQGEPAAVVR